MAPEKKTTGSFEIQKKKSEVLGNRVPSLVHQFVYNKDLHSMLKYNKDICIGFFPTLESELV